MTFQIEWAGSAGEVHEDLKLKKTGNTTGEQEYLEDLERFILSDLERIAEQCGPDTEIVIYGTGVREVHGACALSLNVKVAPNQTMTQVMKANRERSLLTSG